MYPLWLVEKKFTRFLSLKYSTALTLVFSP